MPTTMMPSSNSSVPATSIGQDPPRNRSGRILRKRVKTGCLTCRKRRIKCDEEKPSCKNCIKSKRQCDYNSRLEFKNLPNLSEATSPDFSSAFNNTFGGLPQLQTSFQQPQQRNSFGVHPTPLTPQSFTGQVSAQPTLPQQAFTFQNTPFYNSSDSSLTPTLPSFQFPSQPDDLSSLTTTPAYPSFPYDQGISAQSSQADWQMPLSAASTHDLSNPISDSWLQDPSFTATGSLASNTPTFTDPQDLPNKRRHVGPSTFGSETKAPQNLAVYQPANPEAPHLGRPDHGTVLDRAAVEIQDDDYYDIFPEEANGTYPNVSAADAFTLPSADPISTEQMPVYDNALGTYNEAQAANPLKNPATQLVFKNFIWHTAPALSVFERPSSWGTMLSPPQSMSGSPKSAWMDALPKMALQDPGLLHAMLAQSSYEIAKSQGVSTSPSSKHYAWSLRRVHRALDSPRSKYRITTLAATLLLGFYEILTADHLKWSTHLSGARGLILEADFRGKTQAIRQRVRMAKNAGPFTPSAWGIRGSPSDDNTAWQGFCEPDQSMVEHLMGFRLVESPEMEHLKHFGDLDPNLFQVQQDLFWWYCKQDAYHSIISGNDLLLPFHNWADCPPRSPMGSANAVCGSHDYLMLLLGRIASFSAKDRPRKIRVNKMRPPPEPGGMRPPPKPGERPHPPKPPPPPAFYGMAPSEGPPQLPRAYGTEAIPSVSNDQHLHSTDAELEIATSKANKEWNEIRAACDYFGNRLGPDFQPLSPEEHQPFQTPFGPSCHFKNYEIATFWLVYYMSLLVLIRSHPSKPAAAHVSVGISARETARYANEIGRISAGILPPGMQSEAHYKFLGAYTGSVVPLFFAGVQYQEPKQRLWTVQRLLDIARRCGWTTAETCANGCETSWVKAAELGRGAPWQRISQDLSSADQRLSLNYLHLSGGQPMDPQDRRLLPYYKDSRLLWGFGIMGTIEDLGNLSLNG